MARRGVPAVHLRQGAVLPQPASDERRTCRRASAVLRHRQHRLRTRQRRRAVFRASNSARQPARQVNATWRLAPGRPPGAGRRPADDDDHITSFAASSAASWSSVVVSVVTFADLLQSGPRCTRATGAVPLRREEHDPAAVAAVTITLGLDQPSPCSTAVRSRASSSAATTTDGIDTVALRRAVPGLLVPAAGAGDRTLIGRAAGHRHARARRRHPVAGRRRADRRHLGAAPRHVFDRGGDDLRAGRGVAADLLHRPDAAADSSATGPACMVCPDVHYVPLTDEPGAVVQEPDPALDRAGLPVRGAVRAADPGEHAGDDGRGLHPHRPGQGPARAHGRRSSTACAPRSPRSSRSSAWTSAR